MSCKTACSRLHIHSAALGCGLSVILKYIDERNAQGASNVKRAIRKVIELIGQFPHGGSSTGEEEVRVVPVGHYPYAVYWLVTRREAVILHIRHTPRPDPKSRTLATSKRRYTPIPSNDGKTVPLGARS
jgi:plasmid stabilization system protein ParE